MPLQLRVFVASHFRCLTHLIYVIYCQALHALLTLLIHAPFAHFFACLKIISGWIFSQTKTFCWYYKPCCFYEGSKKVMDLFEVDKFFKNEIILMFLCLLNFYNLLNIEVMRCLFWNTEKSDEENFCQHSIKTFNEEELTWLMFWLVNS